MRSRRPHNAMNDPALEQQRTPLTYSSDSGSVRSQIESPCHSIARWDEAHQCDCVAQAQQAAGIGRPQTARSNAHPRAPRPCRGQRLAVSAQPHRSRAPIAGRHRPYRLHVGPARMANDALESGLRPRVRARCLPNAALSQGAMVRCPRGSQSQPVRNGVPRVVRPLPPAGAL